ncbi:hypothetical protein P9213_11555 [Geobacillus stearothermophilus]|nr:hypothetical protein [Geobacillus stearothermophilus]MED4357255.1 hypothetical protein [Geobacillus stearothermophilus]
MYLRLTDEQRMVQKAIRKFVEKELMPLENEVLRNERPASLIFENVRVPEENILGELHHGYKLGLEWIGYARWVVGACAVGAAERLLQMAIDYFGIQRKLGSDVCVERLQRHYRFCPPRHHFNGQTERTVCQGGTLMAVFANRRLWIAVLAAPADIVRIMTFFDSLMIELPPGSTVSG